MAKIWSVAFGDEFPLNLDHYGYTSLTDLKTIAEKIELDEGAILLDVGCGKGGPGLEIAQKLNLSLIGIDLIPGAIIQANKMKERYKLAFPASFEVGEFKEIPLEDNYADVVLSFDAFWSVEDKVKALDEVKRVMKPGSKFIFTHWDIQNFDPTSIFEKSGMRLISRTETPDWNEYQKKVYEGIIRHQRELVSEMGDSAAMLIYEATSSMAYLNSSIRRIYEMVLDN